MTQLTSAPTVQSVLDVLARERLLDLGRVTGTELRASRVTKRDLAASLSVALGRDRFPAVLRELGRDELLAVCRAHGIEPETNKRIALLERLLIAAGFSPGDSVPPPRFSHDGVPQPGQVMAARGRQWLVEETSAGDQNDSPLLALACLDDDAPGRRLQLLWDLEIGARVVGEDRRG